MASELKDPYTLYKKRQDMIKPSVVDFGGGGGARGEGGGGMWQGSRGQAAVDCCGRIASRLLDTCACRTVTGREGALASLATVRL